MKSGIGNKESNKIKLSIAIPTYNGALLIRETLDSIIPQLKGISEKVEIVISDNASTDTTPEIMKEYQRNYGFIKYFRNDKNVGADKNFDLAVRRSLGEYVWLFSDDDVLIPGAVKKVIEVLRNHPGLGAIFVNWSNYSSDLKRCNIERTIDIGEDILFRKADDFLSTVKLNAIFVSSNIVNRYLWEKVPTEIYVGSNWIHYATLLTLITGHHSYCVAEPYVIYRVGSIHWDKHSERSIKNTISLMGILSGLMEKGYSKRAVSMVTKVVISNLPMDIIQYKRNWLTLREFHIKDMIREFKFYPSFWLICLPLLLLPNQIYNSKIIRLVYRIAKKGHKKLRGKTS